MRRSGLMIVSDLFWISRLVHRTRVLLFVLIGLQALVSGASLVVEILAGRILAPYVGMSLYTWTSIIAVVLAGFSAGHWWGGRIAEQPSSKALSFTAWLMLAAAFATAVAVQLLRLIAEPIMGSISDPVWTIVVLTLGIFFLPSLFAGVPAPVLAHVAIKSVNNNSGRALGSMFAAGALGAIGGTLMAGFVFIPWLGTAATLVIVTAIYVGAAISLFILSHNLRRQRIPIILLAACVIGLSLFSATRLNPCSEESQYYCIRVVDVSAEPSSPIKLMVLDHLSHGTSARDHPRVMFTEFTAMLDEIARRRMGERRFSAFFIGGGTYSVPRAWSDRDTGPITVAEIDPRVTETAMREFWFDPRGIRIIHDDARRVLLTRPNEEYDVIIGDAFGDIAVPEHLVTKQFFELVQKRLAPDGLFLMNVIDFVDDLDALASIHKTLNGVFPTVEVWTEATRPEPAQQRVFVLAAGEGQSDFDDILVPAPEPKKFAVLGNTFASQMLRARRPIILTDDFAPVDRLLSQ